MRRECEMIKEDILDTDFDSYRYIAGEEICDNEIEPLVEALCNSGYDSYWVTEVEEVDGEEVEYYVINKI